MRILVSECQNKSSFAGVRGDIFVWLQEFARPDVSPKRIGRSQGAGVFLKKILIVFFSKCFVSLHQMRKNQESTNFGPFVDIIRGGCIFCVEVDGNVIGVKFKFDFCSIVHCQRSQRHKFFCKTQFSILCFSGV